RWSAFFPQPIRGSEERFGRSRRGCWPTANSFCGTKPKTPAMACPQVRGLFWRAAFLLVDNYILQGRYAEARNLFDCLLSRCNDVGLLAEEFDPLTGWMLGNFPQAYSHVGALNLSQQPGPA